MKNKAKWYAYWFNPYGTSNSPLEKVIKRVRWVPIQIRIGNQLAPRWVWLIILSSQSGMEVVVHQLCLLGSFRWQKICWFRLSMSEVVGIISRYCSVLLLKAGRQIVWGPLVLSLREIHLVEIKMSKNFAWIRQRRCPKIGRLSANPQSSHLLSNVFKYHLIKTTSQTFFCRKVRRLSRQSFFYSEGLAHVSPEVFPVFADSALSSPLFLQMNQLSTECYHLISPGLETSWAPSITPFPSFKAQTLSVSKSFWFYHWDLTYL